MASIPQLYRNVNRWREILGVLSKYGLADWISRSDIGLARDLFARSAAGRQAIEESTETRIRKALTELGPAAIKLGQVLSTRPDVVGVALAEELALLQEDTPATPADVVRGIVESELEMPVAQIFAEFDETPIASASIAQVHSARLTSGEHVVVKVQHPNLGKKIRVDLDILAGLAQLAERIPDLVNYRPVAIVEEFQRTLLRELEFGREERHMVEFAHNLRDVETVRIPRPYADLCSARVLTMERLDGIGLSERSRLKESGIDLEEVARNGAELYMEMIFAHGFYHADPHPGNIVVLPGSVIGLMDFGMVGRIDDSLREDLGDMLMAMANGDAGHLTSIVTRLGHVPADLDHAALEVDVTEYVSHYTSQPLDHFELGRALNEFTELVRRYSIVLPTRVALLIKVLVMLEGTSRLLNPKFNLIEVIGPHQRRMLLRRMSPLRQLRKFRRVYAEIERALHALPRGITEIVQQLQTGKFEVHLEHRGLEPSVNRLVLGLLTSALFVGSSLLLAMKVPPLVREISIPGAAGVAISVALGLRLLRAINQSGHLDSRR